MREREVLIKSDRASEAESGSKIRVVGRCVMICFTSVLCNVRFKGFTSDLI